MPTFGVARRYANDIDAFLQKLHENSIGAYEIGFAYGVPNDFPEDTIKKAENLEIKLSGHIPFFISWSTEEKAINSIEHLSRGIKFASKAKTISVCHLGHYGTRTFEELRRRIVAGIKSAVDIAQAQNNQGGPVLGLETTGKKAEIGTVDEVLSIVADLSTNVAVPVIDWAHIFARSDGKFPQSMDDFRHILFRLENQLGIKSFYFHGSGIEYKNGQEKRHLSLKTCKPPLQYLMGTLRDAGYDYTLIIESPEAIEDLIWFKQVANNPEAYFDFVKKSSGLLDRWTT
jgi:deoxyribonuclease-4